MTLLYHSDYYKIWFQISMTHPMIAQKLLYVIGSRARKNLHLISERGRKSRDQEYKPTKVLSGTNYTYDLDPF